VENEPCQIINLEFHFQSITDDLLSFSSIIRQSRYMMGLLSCQNNYYCLRDSGDLKYLLRSIISTQSIESDRFLLTQLQISELLIRISHSIDEFSLDNRQDTFTYVKKVMNFLEINYDRDLTVDDIAAHVNLHPSYLQKIFKKNLNCTMFAYLKKLRIEKSKMLLSTTDLLITEIPSYIGMNSVQYYVNLFHKINHCTPLQYRKEHSSAFRTDEYDDSFTAKEKK
ncbi:MAG: AraC family transcriptional regulator, partial [Eubacteriales bacterium]